MRSRFNIEIEIGTFELADAHRNFFENQEIEHINRFEFVKSVQTLLKDTWEIPQTGQILAQHRSWNLIKSSSIM